MGLVLNNLKTVDMPLNKETNQSKPSSRASTVSFGLVFIGKARTFLSYPPAMGKVVPQVLFYKHG